MHNTLIPNSCTARSASATIFFGVVGHADRPFQRNARLRKSADQIVNRLAVAFPIAS